MTASPPAAPGMPGEEEIRRIVDDALNSAIPEPWEVSAHATQRILSLIRPAFEAKDAEIERIKREVDLTFMSLIFVPAIRAAIEALPEDDDLQPYRARAEAALSAEAKLAQAVEALDRSMTAIDDWLNVYASDMCDEGRVSEAHSRISNAGGTLAYIAKVQDENRRARSASAAARGET